MLQYLFFKFLPKLTHERFFETNMLMSMWQKFSERTTNSENISIFHPQFKKSFKIHVCDAWQYVYINNV